MKLPGSQWQRGFSLTELVMVMVILGVVATYAVTRGGSPSAATGSAQAQEFARDLRHAQMLAMTWGKALVVTVTGSGYSVACATAGAAPCNASPVIDPARGAAFAVALTNGATLGPGSVRFDSLGRPSTGVAPSTSDASFTLTSSGTWTVTMRAVSGLVE